MDLWQRLQAFLAQQRAREIEKQQTAALIAQIARHRALQTGEPFQARPGVEIPAYFDLLQDRTANGGPTRLSVIRDATRPNQRRSAPLLDRRRAFDPQRDPWEM